MSSFTLNLVEGELKIILESLIEREARMLHICETSDDEDEIADVCNDLAVLRLLLRPLKERAVQQYGNHVLEFSREPLVVKK